MVTKKIFVNLKRFDVSKAIGGICPMNHPEKWIEWIIDESVEKGLGKLKDAEVVFLLPEGLILSAVCRLGGYPEKETRTIQIGCQGVFREDVAVGGNFGAFTTNRPAAAAKNMGCTWTIIGHSEERKDKLGIIAEYDPGTLTNAHLMEKAKACVDKIINDEIICALQAGINVLICVGETGEDRGDGSFEQQKPGIERVLKTQLVSALKGIENKLEGRNIVIGYEPIWAIGPGKIPPGGDYIAFVSSYIKKAVFELFGMNLPVVYGGGLKEENAGMISGVETIDGGLVALTRFSGDIGFYPKDLKRIIEKYQE